MDSCAEYGYVYEEPRAERIAGELAGLGPRYRNRLAAGAEVLRRRPAPGVWSALEYACHVRDMLLTQRERVYLALVEERPSFAKMHRDERVTLAQYATQRPAEVAEELEMAARLVARAFADLDEAAWRRPCIYNYPVPQERTLLWVARHTQHEGEHHLLDIDRAIGPRPAPS
jgi:hypothetical protein